MMITVNNFCELIIAQNFLNFLFFIIQKSATFFYD